MFRPTFFIGGEKCHIDAEVADEPTVINFLIRFDFLGFLRVRVFPWLDSRDMVVLLL